MKIYKIILDDYSYYYHSKENALTFFQRELDYAKTSDDAINFRQPEPYYFSYYDNTEDRYTYIRFKEIDDSEIFSD